MQQVMTRGSPRPDERAHGMVLYNAIDIITMKKITGKGVSMLG